MKAKITRLLLAASAVLLIFTGCEKNKETSAVAVDLSKRVTIKCYIYADLDLTRDGLETVPAGTQVVISIPYSDFNNIPSANNKGNWSTTVQTDADGVISANVPVDANGVSVQIAPIDFEYDQIQNPLYHKDATIKKIFKASPLTENILPNVNKTLQITYADDVKDSYTEFAQIAGEVKAELDEKEDGMEFVPQGTKITFEIADQWYSTTTIGIDGKYSISVPADESIKVEGYFTYDKNVYDADNDRYVRKQYKYTIWKSLGSFAFQPEGFENKVDFDFGNGVESKK